MTQGKIIRCIKATYELMEQVDKGSYGIVYKARRLSDDEIFAIKMPVEKDEHYNLYSKQQKEKVVSKLREEIKFLKKIGSQADKYHIIPLVDWNDDSNQDDPIMVMPFCESNLSVYCREKDQNYPFSCDEFLSLIEQILIPLDYIKKTHTDSIHRDVKTDNILVKNKKLYLCDFGAHKKLKRTGTASLAGTVLWGAPEQFIPQKIESSSPDYRLTDKADIYPVGLIMFMMITFRGNYPKAQTKIETLMDLGGRCRDDAPDHFQKIGGLEPHEKKMCIKYLIQLADQESLPFPEEFVNACINFLEQLLCPVIEQRLDANSALSKIKVLKNLIHPKLTKFNVCNSKHRFSVRSPITLIIDIQGTGLPEINKWLSIQVKELKYEISIQSINFIKNNHWKVVTNGIRKEGQYTLDLLTFNPNKKTSYQINIYKPSEILWKEKNYKDALLDYHHFDYPKWLKQIKTESKKSKKRQQEWIAILKFIKERVSLKNKPELHALCDELESSLEEANKRELRIKQQKDKIIKVLHNIKKNSNTFIKISIAVLCIIVCLMSYNKLHFLNPLDTITEENTDRKVIDDRTTDSVEFSNAFHSLIKVLSEFRIFNYFVDSLRNNDIVKNEAYNIEKHEKIKKPLIDKMSPWHEKVRGIIDKKKGYVYKLLNIDVLALNDSKDTQLVQKAIEHYRLENWKQVIVILRELINNYPKSQHIERAHFILALCMDRYLRQQMPVDLEKIVITYREAIELCPGSYYIPYIQLEIGNIYFQLGEYYNALLYYKLADRSKINIHPDVLINYGISYALINKTKQSIQIFGRLISKHPTSLQAVKARVEMAKAMFQQKAFSASIKVLNTIREKDPDIIYEHPDILLYVGYNLYEMGQFQKARDTLFRAINIFPNMKSNHLVLTRIADLYWEDGFIDMAKNIYNQVYQTYPDTDGALISTIRLIEHTKVTAKERNTKRNIDAIKFNRLPAEVYDEISQKYKNNPLAQLALLKAANQKEKEGKYKDAIKIIIRLLKNYPTTKLRSDAQITLRTSLEALTHLLHNRKEYNSIVSHFDKYLKHLSLKDFSGQYMLELGNAYLALNLYRRAQKLYVRASERFVNKDQPADIFFGMGESAFHLKETDNALRYFQRFISKFPSDHRINIAFSRMGNIAYKQKDYINAIDYFEKAIQKKVKYPELLTVYLKLGRSYRNTERLDFSIFILKKNIDLFSQYKQVPLEIIFDVYYELGEVYFQIGNKKEAVVAFEEALQSLPKGKNSIPIEFRLAECYSHLQIRDKAEKILYRIINSNSDDQFWSKMSKAMLKEIENNRRLENYFQLQQIR